MANCSALPLANALTRRVLINAQTTILGMCAHVCRADRIFAFGEQHASGLSLQGARHDHGKGLPDAIAPTFHYDHRAII